MTDNEWKANFDNAVSFANGVSDVHENALLKQGLFGRRSERLNAGQLGFFDDALDAAPAEIPERSSARPEKKSGHGRAAFPEHLPREVIELDLAEAARECDGCGKPLQRIGEEVTERGHIIPARLVVKRYVRPSRSKII